MLAAESLTSRHRLREGWAGVGLEPQRLPVCSDPLSLRRRHGLGRETRGLRGRGLPRSGSPALPGAPRVRCLSLPSGGALGPSRCQTPHKFAGVGGGASLPRIPCARPPGRRVRSRTGKRQRLSHPERQAFPRGAQGCGARDSSAVEARGSRSFAGNSEQLRDFV